MASQGDFRDDFYNAVGVLTQSQMNNIAQASGIISASLLASASENYIQSSGATALTTDSAANIIARLQTVIMTQHQAALYGYGAGVYPPPGVPNLFNFTFFVQICNMNAGLLTITGGAGVTLIGNTGIVNSGARQWVVSVTGPNAVTFNNIGLNTAFTA